MKIGTKEFSLKNPVIMGVINVTPDSFSDGGDFADSGRAIKYALKMEEEGADIIDIGGESSRPGSDPVSGDEELRRVMPVIEGIRKSSKIPISIDTTKSVVAERALEAGADMINDISAGTFDPQILAVAAEAEVPICLMHMRKKPKTMQTGEIVYNDVVSEIAAYLAARIEEAVKAGVSREKIIIDPGIGFGKTVEHNITIINELSRLKELGCPILIGTSRKSFIGKIMGLDNPKERLEGTLLTHYIAIKNGANIIRVHDVAPHKKLLSIPTGKAVEFLNIGASCSGVFKAHNLILD